VNAGEPGNGGRAVSGRKTPRVTGASPYWDE
jgi:hypothetical protein